MDNFHKQRKVEALSSSEDSLISNDELYCGRSKLFCDSISNDPCVSKPRRNHVWKHVMDEYKLDEGLLLFNLNKVWYIIYTFYKHNKSSTDNNRFIHEDYSVNCRPNWNVKPGHK